MAEATLISSSDQKNGRLHFLVVGMCRTQTLLPTEYHNTFMLNIPGNATTLPYQT